MSSGLSRTPIGLSVVDQFYSAASENVVYVEGPDDVRFWELAFPRRANGLSLKVQSVGGKNNLPTYEQAIRQNGAKFIVAKDSDYSWCISSIQPHAYVVVTHGYSIENYMVSPGFIHLLICEATLASSRTFLRTRVDSWLVRLNLEIDRLARLDIASQRINPSPRCTPTDLQSIMAVQHGVPKVSRTLLRQYTSALEVANPSLLPHMEHSFPCGPVQHFNGHSLIAIISKYVSYIVSSINGRGCTVSSEEIFDRFIEQGSRVFQSDPELRKLRSKAIATANKLARELTG